MHIHWRNKLEGSVIPQRQERSPTPQTLSAFGCRHPAIEVSRSVSCTTLAAGLVPRDLCQLCCWGLSLPKDAHSCLPVGSPLRTPSSPSCIPTKPEHAASYPALPEQRGCLLARCLWKMLFCAFTRGTWEKKCCLVSSGSAEDYILSGLASPFTAQLHLPIFWPSQIISLWRDSFLSLCHF